MPSQEVVTTKVVVHPLVLLSVVDHFTRMGKIGNQKRVVGVLLGSWRAKGVLDVSNSFAVLVIIDAKPKDLGLPTEAYQAVEEVHDDGSPTSKTFEHIPSEIGAEEAEEVGVEHLLRDIKDTTVGTLSQRITNQLLGLKGIHAQLREIKDYLIQVSTGKLPINHQIVYQLQDIFNLLPDMTQNTFVDSLYIKTNDQMLVVYLAALVRSIIALHNLINNKLTNRDAEKKETDKKTDIKKEEKKEDEKKDEKEKAKAK
ncbi:Similar to Rpn8: 26S proteasome non-ATPase regulatory subunit 7 (Drosophila melanogaster) [Cotesia congregata]|uniref:Similar to Rpn8: 26S proteasome non-ATPase regulatory subunit 7 (Drosophila melanogaster) n=1 Tax=Cotesia congregata TaxID=51543 RepID=A0A8J2HEL6_COTCN|nr:Similar to Rpn8: 26S proteasome non-ATPase regulatory subunit 7 (Drosophila melanogaster) [Cotesia congregata]